MRTLRPFPLAPRTLTRLQALLVASAIAVAAALALQTAVRSARRAATTSQSMAAMLPGGALLSIEAPDFAALLADWTSSPQSRAWLSSDNYAVFANSRLFGRLSAAQDEFSKAAGIPAGTSLLHDVAGERSIFAWYDVGNLEFLYITRIPSGRAAGTPLMQARAKWSARQSGAATFYVRQSPGHTDSGRSRTVAFAEVPTAGGDLLLLSTREDLMAGALTLIAAGKEPAPPASLASEPWYVDASAALKTVHPDTRTPLLHMVLNLDRLVPLPYFRSYWVQRNVTEMGQYRCAASDLFRDASSEGAGFREERGLVLKASASAAQPDPELASLASMAPSDGVFRAVETEDPELATAALNEKLLGHSALTASPSDAAPDPSLDPISKGSNSDLETRIDTPPPVPASSSSIALAQLIKSAGLDAVLTYDSASLPTAESGLWVPIHSAVVLRGSATWNATAVAGALQESLRTQLTTSNLGLDVQREEKGKDVVYRLGGPGPLYFATVATPRGNLLLLANESSLLLKLLAEAHTPSPSQEKGNVIAGFNHTAQRPAYLRLTSLIDGKNQSAPENNKGSSGTPPAYFSRNLRSLSNAFSALENERFKESRGLGTDGLTVHQTVSYQWQKP